jgi:pyridoxine kinase
VVRQHRLACSPPVFPESFHEEVSLLHKRSEPQKILCIHDLSGVGRCSLAVILPVLTTMGIQPIALPTVLLSTHTGGFGTPARLDGADYCAAALDHYHALGLTFDCIYSGYLGGEAQVALVEKAFALWPQARKVVDPVMGDNGHAYSTVTPALIDRIRALCHAADLILPNFTEAHLLLQKPYPQDALDVSPEAAQALADELSALAPSVVITGVPMGKFIGCAGGGKDRFVLKKLHLDRSFPGTGDLYGALLCGSMMRGNVLSAAADAAAEFVSLAIQNTPRTADTRFGVWFEPLLPRLAIPES